ncbi:MAG: helix-turn-helix domain-containing protein [Candidatus Diapherotrites archaeon]
MDLVKGLASLGLSANEANVYLTLVRSGASPVIRIARSTGINRRSVYDSLESLVSMGLVNYAVVEKKKLFQPTDLNSLSALMDERSRITELLKSELKKTLVRKQEEPLIEIFSGKNSMKGVFERLLESKETIHIYGGAMPAKDFLEYYYLPWTNKRLKSGIKVKGIFVDSPKVKPFVKSLPLITYKFIEEEYLSPAFWWLQGNNIYLVFFQENPVVVSVKSRDLARTYLNSFNLLWKRL